MELLLGLAMVLGIGPALALMYLVVRNYTYPKVEQPFFSDPAFFGLFIVGLVEGSVLYMALALFRFASNPIYMVLFAAVELMAMLVVMNLRRFRGKSDSVFYGYAIGLGMSSGLATGICFVLAKTVEHFDASAITIVVISVSLALILGACGTNVGEGIARHLPMQYLLQGLILLIAYNLLFTVVLQGGELGGEIVYYVCQVMMLVLSAFYFYRIMYVKLPGVVRDVLKMEGKKRDDIPGSRRSRLVDPYPDLGYEAAVQHGGHHLLGLRAGYVADVLHGERSLDLGEPLSQYGHLGLEVRAVLVSVDEGGVRVGPFYARLLLGGVRGDEAHRLGERLPDRALVVRREVDGYPGVLERSAAVRAGGCRLGQVDDPGTPARVAPGQPVPHAIACTP